MKWQPLCQGCDFRRIVSQQLAVMVFMQFEIVEASKANRSDEQKSARLVGLLT
jgi:hypothetical protein